MRPGDITQIPSSFDSLHIGSVWLESEDKRNRDVTPVDLIDPHKIWGFAAVVFNT
jgi:hypothetical protein